MSLNFRKAISSEIPHIWIIIKSAILRRKQDGSKQWQDGYPNENTIQNDIEKEVGYVLTDNNRIIGYSAILINDEPAYHEIKGTWLTNNDFVVVHRMAVSEQELGKGLARKMLLYTEEIALQNNIFSVKADTNFDNAPMLKIFENLGYVYCGEVTFKGGIRKAFEKKLKNYSTL
jgi:GNAT superfamily N-acetyltransferase